MSFEDWIKLLSVNYSIDYSIVLNSELYNDVDICFDKIELLKDASINSINLYSNFVYDKATSSLIIGFKCGNHNIFMGCLYNLITGKNLNFDIASDEYVDKYGFFMSSVSTNKKIITIGPNFILSPEEKLKFRNFSFTSLDDHEL